MTAEQRLTVLKHNLELLTNAHDNYLLHLMEVGRGSLMLEGIKLDEDNSVDDNLIIDYAAYLFRSRAAQSSNANDYTSMPRSLRYAINVRLMGQKARGDEE